LAHSGIKANCLHPSEGRKQINFTVGGWQTLTTSPIPFYEDDITPTQVSVDDLQATIQSFVNGTKTRALDAIALKYKALLNQFLSPRTNKKADKYGGSLNNHTFLLSQVTTGMHYKLQEEILLFAGIFFRKNGPLSPFKKEHI
jgi:2,4-dienoyl-CoA reductase-like NADH-dependent reductase (Old Yellow Enzyme family)